VKDAQTQVTVATYAYDYLGRRVRKTVGTVVTKYCYDKGQVIAEYNDSDTFLRMFVYGPGIDEPICMISNGGIYYYHFDGLGSVVALSDGDGYIVESYSYDVFGEPTIRNSSGQKITSSNYDNPYMFTGRRYDNETGLYYYRARHYDPNIGRFLQTDPISYAGGLNLYAYCRNNPINLFDPFGLRHYGAEETRTEIMDDAKANLHPMSSTIPPWLGGHDYKMGDDTFVVPFFWGQREREGSEVGNMIAGYKNTYQSGLRGALGAYSAGLIYATIEHDGRFWVEWTDGSVWDITEGVIHGFYERYTEWPWVRGKHLLKGIWKSPSDAIHIYRAYAEAYGLLPATLPPDEGDSLGGSDKDS